LRLHSTMSEALTAEAGLFIDVTDVQTNGNFPLQSNRNDRV
jgi:hypothetical protein